MDAVNKYFTDSSAEFKIFDLFKLRNMLLPKGITYLSIF